MRCRRLLMAMVLAMGAAAPAAAQAPRTEAEVRAGPRDIREIFLAVPLPESGWVDESFPLQKTLATYARRRAVLDAALARGGPNVLDPRNGYLKLRIRTEYSESDSLDLVMTYFVQDGGRRLVVMQTAGDDPRNGQPMSTDYFWQLDGGRFTPASEVLPDITYEDFWGDHPVPDLGESFFYDWHALHVEWPRQGTTARVRIFTPGFLAEGEDEYDPGLVELFERRRFSEMELLWDRRRGVFSKGAKTPYEPEGDEHDHH
jgi:hypothetical protein